MIEVRYETRLVCPDELTRDLPARPPVPAGAVVEANDPGAAWLASVLSVADTVRALFDDARAACPAQGPSQP